jgi:hypothetical protein
MSDFSQWLEGAPLVPAAEEITFDTWLDGGPVFLSVETDPPSPAVPRRRAWMASFETVIFATTPIIARFTFEDESLAGWSNGPSVETLVHSDFEADSFDDWFAAAIERQFEVEAHDFEDENLTLWTTG